MKKILLSLFTLIALTTLVGCGTNIQSDLQSKEWNVVSTNGESYTAQFGESTVTFEMLSFQFGNNYSIEDNKITIQESEGEKTPVTFEITKNENDYQFKTTTAEDKEQYGNLTLSPKVSNQ